MIDKIEVDFKLVEKIVKILTEETHTREEAMATANCVYVTCEAAVIHRIFEEVKKEKSAGVNADGR